MKNVFKSIAMIALALSFTACSDDDNTNEQVGAQTIAEIAVSNPNLSILVQALDRAGLVGTFAGEGDFTVFAPTNAAFTAFLNANGFDNLEDVPLPLLTEVLKNHVIGQGLTSSELSTGYVKTLAVGSASATNTLSMYIDLESGVTINGGAANGGANVVLESANIEASNGIIHVVDNVIGLPTVVNHAIANPNFGILVQALTREDQPDFAGILSGTENSPFTVFAPTDAAFVALLGELELTALADVPADVLESALRYHVVTGANVLASSLTNNQSVPTFEGGAFTINLANSAATITDESGRVTNIIATDVQATNGVVHAIDQVLLPN